jgi:hypothetical protein
MSTMDFTVRAVTAAQWPALEDLFGRSGASNGCWCMYWRIGPRYRDRPRADNKEELRQLAASARPPGLLAFDEDRAVGWCELAREPNSHGWRVPGISARSMTCPSGRSRVSTSGRPTAAGALWTP